MNKMSFCGSSGGFDGLLCCVNGDWWVWWLGLADHGMEPVGGWQQMWEEVRD
jgi:hypothetical protein